MPVMPIEEHKERQLDHKLEEKAIELLGLSVDSVSSHIAWIRNVEEKMGVKIPFPIIADLNLEVSMKFRMIHPAQSKTETVRTVFIMDPESKIRTILYYPLTTDRNMKNLLEIYGNVCIINPQTNKKIHKRTRKNVFRFS